MPWPPLLLSFAFMTGVAVHRREPHMGFPTFSSALIACVVLPLSGGSLFGTVVAEAAYAATANAEDESIAAITTVIESIITDVNIIFEYPHLYYGTCICYIFWLCSDGMDLVEMIVKFYERYYYWFVVLAQPNDE
jgi:hypothetical protein